MPLLSDELILFIYIYLFSFLGAFSKDMVDTFLEKITEVLIMKVLISSLTVAMFLYGSSEYLLEKLSHRPFTALCYMMGLVSFEVVARYSTLENVLNFIIEFNKWKTGKKQR